MKVLIVDRTTTSIGGVKTYVSSLDSLLRELGHDVIIYSTGSSSSIIDKWVIGGVRYLVNKIYRPYGIIVDATLFSLLERWIIPNNIDFIFYQSLAIHGSGKKSASVIHALWSDNLQGGRLSTSAVKRLMAFERSLITNETYCMFTVSDAYARHISSVHKCNILPVIENFLNEEFESIRWNDRHIDIIYTGQFNARKKILYLLEIVRAIHERNRLDGFSVCLVGSGPEEHEIRDYIKLHSLSHVVDIINNPKREIIKKLISRSKVFLLPSIKESFSYSLLEAKLSGCITFARSNLEVPIGFVDVSMPDDSIADTVANLEMILKAESKPKELQNNQFSNPIFQATYKIKKLLEVGGL